MMINSLFNFLYAKLKLFLVYALGYSKSNLRMVMIRLNDTLPHMMIMTET